MIHEKLIKKGFTHDDDRKEYYFFYMVDIYPINLVVKIEELKNV